MNNPKDQKSISKYIKLEDYKVFDYEIPEIFLDFVIKKNSVYVKTKLKLVKKNKNTKKLMLPYSLRKDYISFTDKKWDWRYQFNKDGSPDINNPSLYELLPSGEVKAHFCQSEDKNSKL